MFARLIPLFFLLMPLAAQEPLRIDNVVRVAPFIDSTIIIARDEGAPNGLALHLVQAPIFAFRVELPDSLVLQDFLNDGGGSTILVNTWVSTSGMRIVVTTPCKKYYNLSACVKAHMDAIGKMEEVMPVDKEATRKSDTPIQIVTPK